MSKKRVIAIAYTTIIISCLCILSAVLTGKFSKRKYKFAIANNTTTLNEVGKILKKELNDDLHVDFILNEDSSSARYNFELLEKGKADFAMASNVIYEKGTEAASFSNIRTVLPLYRMAMLILYPKSLPHATLHQLIVTDKNKKRKVGLGPRGANTALLVLEVFKEFGIDTSDFTAVYTPFPENRVTKGKIDIACQFTGLFQKGLKSKLYPDPKDSLSYKDINIFSFENNPSPDRFSWTTTGICRKLWTSSPIVIAPNFYGDKPESAVFTISLQCCLYCNKEVDPRTVYNVITSINNKKSNYIKQNPDLQDIDPTFSDNYFYPLHDGAINYQDKDKPSFLEQKSGLYGLLISIGTVIASTIGVILSLRKKYRSKQRKYELQIQQIIEISSNTHDNPLEKLQVVKNEVLDRLKAGKLSYDDELKNILLYFTQVEANILKTLEQNDREQNNSDESNVVTTIPPAPPIQQLQVIPIT